MLRNTTFGLVPIFVVSFEDIEKRICQPNIATYKVVVIHLSHLSDNELYNYFDLLNHLG